MSSSAHRDAKQARIRRRRRVLMIGTLGVLMVIAASAWALRPEPSSGIGSYVSESAVDQAAEAAKASAGEAAKAAEEVEQRAWALGPYVEEVPPRDGIASGAPVKGLVALTFDDGPDRATYDVLALLKRHKMKATFFVLGQLAEKNPDALRQMVDEGHVVANHSWGHQSMLTLDAAGLAKEFDGTSKLIREVTGRPVTLMRPPFGDFDARTNRWVRRNGMYPIMWNVDSADWRVEDPRQIAANILDAPGLGPGAIILLHDGGGDRSATVNALPMILDGLAKRGLRSVTLPELLRAGPPQGITPGSYAPSRYAEG